MNEAQLQAFVVAAILVAGSAFVLGASCGEPAKTPLDHVADPTVRDAALLEALLALKDADVAPSFWTAIVEDSRYTPTHRRRCMFAYLARSIKEGARLEDLRSILRVGEWFRATGIVDITEATDTPFRERRVTQSIFALRPELPTGNDSVLCLKLSDRIRKPEFVAALSADVSAPSQVTVLEIVIDEFN